MARTELDPNRPRVPELVEAIVAVYLIDNGVCHCCHVLFDNENYDCVEFCLGEARKNNCAVCTRACELAAKMSMTQLRTATRIGVSAGYAAQARLGA